MIEFIDGNFLLIKRIFLNLLNLEKGFEVYEGVCQKVLEWGEVGACPTWSRWKDRDDPSGQADYELLTGGFIKYNQMSTDMCEKPSAVQARIRGNHDGFTPQEVEISQDGFACWNSKQTSGRYCFDYEV